MKARPILMHARSIQNLLAGRKTQTRRIVKGFEIARLSSNAAFRASSPHPLAEDRSRRFHYVERPDGEIIGVPCPYGQPGDLLWVRETSAWAKQHRGRRDLVQYRADGDIVSTRRGVHRMHWTPSIHMPRWASRLTLRLTDVRVERVQDISHADAEAEGCRGDDKAGPADYFADLWNDTNGPGTWERNDWAWALTFEVVRANVDEVLRGAERRAEAQPTTEGNLTATTERNDAS